MRPSVILAFLLYVIECTMTNIAVSSAANNFVPPKIEITRMPMPFFLWNLDGSRKSANSRVGSIFKRTVNATPMGVIIVGKMRHTLRNAAHVWEAFPICLIPLSWQDTVNLILIICKCSYSDRAERMLDIGGGQNILGLDIGLDRLVIEMDVWILEMMDFYMDMDFWMLDSALWVFM